MLRKQCTDYSPYEQRTKFACLPLHLCLLTNLDKRRQENVGCECLRAGSGVYIIKGGHGEVNTSR